MSQAFRYDLTAGAAPAGWTRMDIDHLSEAAGRWTRLIESSDHQIANWAYDLQHVAYAAYLADRLSRRHGSAFDNWTRHIELRIPVKDLARWGSAAPTLNRTLGVLTGDSWNVEFRLRRNPYAMQASFDQGWHADEVAMFSGGLDSTAYAAERAAIGCDRTLLLAAFHHGRLRTQQQNTHRHVQRLTRTAPKLVQIHQRPRGRGFDQTQRTRGFLYMAAGAFAAAGHGLTTVAVPENGAIAVNTPLTASRASACSTRSVHPTTLHLFNQLIQTIGGDVTVTNPYCTLTKGDVCRRARAAGLSDAAVWETVSCSHPHRQRQANCGLCYPCLIRRAGLHSAYGHDGTAYGSILTEVKDDNQASADLRAVVQWARRDYTIDDILADIPIPDSIDLDSVLNTSIRAHREMITLLAAYRPDLLGSR